MTLCEAIACHLIHLPAFIFDHHRGFVPAQCFLFQHDHIVFDTLAAEFLLTTLPDSVSCSVSISRCDSTDIRLLRLTLLLLVLWRRWCRSQCLEHIMRPLATAPKPAAATATAATTTAMPPATPAKEHNICHQNCDQQHVQGSSGQSRLFKTPAHGCKTRLQDATPAGTFTRLLQSQNDALRCPSGTPTDADRQSRKKGHMMVTCHCGPRTPLRPFCSWRRTDRHHRDRRRHGAGRRCPPRRRRAGQAARGPSAQPPPSPPSPARAAVAAAAVSTPPSGHCGGRVQPLKEQIRTGLTASKRLLHVTTTAAPSNSARTHVDEGSSACISNWRR